MPATSGRSQSFATASAEYGDEVMGRDVGMAGAGAGAGGGRIRSSTASGKSSTVSASWKRRKLTALAAGGSSGATGGMASSLAFSSAQGIELVNPDAAAERARKAKAEMEGYFAASGAFSTVRR